MNDFGSTFFFPLRTNVQYFTAPEGFVSLEGRIKQAVVLYERVFFQSGLYEASMGPDGTFDTHAARTQMPTHRESQVFKDRVSSSSGFSVWFQPNGPGTEPLQVMSSAIERFFSAEFHSLVDNLSTEIGVTGLELVDVILNDRGQNLARQLAEEHLNIADAVLPQGSPPVQKHIIQNLFKDLVLLSSTGFPGGMDPLHAPLLEQVIHRAPEIQVAPGFSALKFEVPHVAALPWDSINEARAHPAIVEFRQRLLTAENIVRTMLPDASEAEIRAEVGSVLHRDLIKEVKARMASTGIKLTGGVTLELLGSVLPGAGNIQAALSVGKRVADAARDSRSWLAVLMKLSNIEQ